MRVSSQRNDYSPKWRALYIDACGLTTARHAHYVRGRLHEARELSLLNLKSRLESSDREAYPTHAVEVGKSLIHAPLDERVLPTDGVEHIAGGNFSSTAWICLLR